MRSSRIILSAIIFFSSWAKTGLSQGEELFPNALPCLERLLPCQPFVHLMNKPPPACCGPLEDLLLGDQPSCLCDVFFNPDVLRNFNLTQTEALNLPKNCGIKPNLSLCKTVAPGPTSSADPRRSLRSVVADSLMVGGMFFVALAF